MPELPEVETIKKGLLEKVLERPILKVEVRDESVLRNKEKSFKGKLERGIFKSIDRRGKMLIFSLEEAGAKKEKTYLLARLGMTGQLIFLDREKAREAGCTFGAKEKCIYKHYRIGIYFADDSVLLFNDSRKFGYLEIVGEKRLQEKLQNFGPEPLERDFNLSVFRGIIDKKKTNIKAFLLNQKFVAGIGNIYADEILFDAGVMPTRIVLSLSEEEIQSVYKSIKKILKKAVENRGTTFSDYRDAEGRRGKFKKFLKVYGREGEPCACCKGGVVQKMVVAGRGTSYCRSCQK